MQNWTRLYSYITDYQNLVYDYYSKTGVAFLIDYYNLNTTTTVWDDEYMFNGSYEKIGDLTGIKFDKYLLLPIYFIEEISTVFDGTETGYNKEGETSIVYPNTYGITPYPGDLVKFQQAFMRPTNDIYPVYQVTGIEIHPNTDKRFWKLKLKSYHNTTTTEVDTQVTNTYTFFDYDKKIHNIADATTLAQMMSKSETIKSRLKNIWDENTGFYST